MTPDEAIPLMLAFLDRIGIPYSEGELDGEGFLPGLRIVDGGLVIDRTKLKYPGDILHEAGHIALTNPDKRQSLNQAVLDAQSRKESEEVGVELWSYLAAKEIGVPPEIVFHSDGYKGSGEHLVSQYEKGNLIGLPLLIWMGVCAPGDPLRVVSWLRVGGL